MAGLAEMSISPAEPLCYVATELALELDKVCSVFLTNFLATTNADSGALTTHQLHLLEIIVVILPGLTILHTSEVWFLTLEALIV